MRTENDLRTALRYRAEQAPDTGFALAEHARTAGRPNPARSGLALGLTAAAVIALIAIPVAARGLLTGSAGPTGTSPTAQPANGQSVTGSALSWATISVSDPVVRDLRPGAEFLTVQLATGGHLQVSDYPPNGFDPNRLIAPAPVTVAGRQAYFGRFDDGYRQAYALDSWPDPGSGSPARAGRPQPSLAWPVAGNQWVVLSGDTPALQTAAGLAAAVPGLHLAARTSPVRLPFRFGYLPAGWQLSTAAISDLTVDFPHQRSASAVELTNGSRTLSVELRRASMLPAPGTAVSRPPNSGTTAGPATSSGPRLSLTRVTKNVAVLDPVTGKATDYQLTLLSTPGTFDRGQAEQLLDSIDICRRPDTENASWFDVRTLLH